MRPFGQRRSGPHGSSGHLSSYLLSYCSVPPLAISPLSLASSASALNSPHQRCCHSDSGQMFDATLAKSKAKAGRPGSVRMQMNALARRGGSCTTLGASISSVICKATQENSTFAQTRIQIHVLCQHQRREAARLLPVSQDHPHHS